MPGSVARRRGTGGDPGGGLAVAGHPARRPAGAIVGTREGAERNAQLEGGGDGGLAQDQVDHRVGPGLVQAPVLAVGDVGVRELVDRGPGRRADLGRLRGDPLTHPRIQAGADQDEPAGPGPLGPLGDLVGVGHRDRPPGRGPDPGGRQAQHGREQHPLDRGADLRPQPGHLLGDRLGPGRLQVTGPHRRPGGRQHRTHRPGRLIGPLRGPRGHVQHRGQLGVHHLVLIPRPGIGPPRMRRSPGRPVRRELLTGAPRPRLDPQHLHRRDGAEHPLGRRDHRLRRGQVPTQHLLAAQPQQRGSQRGHLRGRHLIHAGLEHTYDSSSRVASRGRPSTGPIPSVGKHFHVR